MSRRYPAEGGYTLDQAKEIAALSRSIGRQVGICIDRRGRVVLIIVGTPSGILIPDLPRARESFGRLRGLRILHTHLGKDLLSQEDCMDMLFLRLDGISVLTVGQWGEPERFQRAHLLPPNPQNETYTIHPPTSWDRVDTDFFAEVTALEDELARAGQQQALQSKVFSGDFFEKDLSPLETAIQKSRELNALADAKKRAILVSVSTQAKPEQQSSLTELAELATTAGVAIANTLTQRVRMINPKFILGKGKIAELEVLALQGNAGLIIFEGELSPSQLRNVTAVTKRVVLDRTQLILDIFANRATSKAGKIQVELAQLEYMLPRLVGKSGGALDRLAGGIGGKGPGETKLETDRRRLRDRIARIKDELKELRKQRSFTRARRAKGGIPVASLVGYTNAGKSTLLNALTGSAVLAENKLFATLDPTSRRLRFPKERELILTDTVGFIRSLPSGLMEAFRATLEELAEADLLLHVADASHPELDRQVAAVSETLGQLELLDKPCLHILNKADSLAPEDVDILQARYPEAIFVSALSGAGLKELVAAIAGRIDWSVEIEVEQKTLPINVETSA